MEQLVSTGLQMMQMDLSIDRERLCVIRALNTISFDDLHKIICHKLSVPVSVSYAFYLPKSELLIRRITRSFEESAASRITSYVQSGDTIYYRIYHSEFHVRFSSVGVVDEESAMEAKLLATQGKIRNMAKKTIISRNFISKKSLYALYDLGERLYDGGIFSYLPDKQFLMIHMDDMLQPVYVENKAHQFLLYFFADEESYRRFFCVCKDTLPQQSIYKYKHASVMRISKKPLPTLPYRRYGDSFISFLDMRRGWEMDGISEGAAQELQMILPVLLRALTRMRYEIFRISMRQGILHIYNHARQNMCQVRIQPPETMVLPVIPYEQQHNIDALQGKETLSTFLEMDYHFIRQPYKGNVQQRRAYLLNVSALGPHIRSHYEHIFDKEQNIKNALLDMMINILVEHGRPKTILVKDRYVYSILADLCRKLRIFIQIEPRLLYTEAYFADNERVIYDLEVVEREVQPIKKAAYEQPLQQQYNRKNFKMKGYFNS